eukprot:gene19006-21619_t
MRIIITSALGNADRRHACRVTWLKWVKDLQHTISYSFYVDAPTTDADRVRIQEEASLFQDIVVLNATMPKDFNQACNFRRWEAMAIEYNHFQEKIDYYAVADDDSFICIHHLMSDSKYWPVSKHVHIAHFRGGPDVISIYSRLLVKNALQLIPTHPGMKHSTLFQMSHAIKGLININDVRLTFGARGQKEKHYNDLKNGWIGVDLLKNSEKNSICNHYLSFHQVYPDIMLDLWRHVSARPSPKEFTVPILSRDTIGLDTTKGYL